MNDSSVLIAPGYNYTNGTNSSSMGMIYYDPNLNEYTVPSGYADLIDKPTQRVLHQVVMSPDKGSLFLFGGLVVKDKLEPYAEIFQYNIRNSTFYKYDNFTLVGGTATMLP
jgi:hypothetical protein